MDRTRILTRSEVWSVLHDLRRRRRAVNSRQNAVIFRLACCCGLRVGEIVGLTMANVKLGGERPHIHIAARQSKSRRVRRVPCWWDGGTLAALMEWKAERVGQGAGHDDPFVCNLVEGTAGKRMLVRTAQNRWRTAIRVLGPERVKTLSIHCGRHSFCSHALAGGRSLAEVRDAAGHANISTTSIYLHAGVEDDVTIGNLFEFEVARNSGWAGLCSVGFCSEG